MVNSSKRSGLGQTLSRAQKTVNQKRFQKKSNKHIVDLSTKQETPRTDLRSVTAQTNLDEFLEEVELAGRQFITEKRNLALINEQDETRINLYKEHERVDTNPGVSSLDEENALSVPRRPKWDSTTTPEQLEDMEKRSFLVWRRKLARLQEADGVTLTPFEKNLEVWRQLWRVVERSDVIVQILDCRNPLLYLCDDLIKYVNEEFQGKKMNLILLNKADFLTLEQRRMWAKYFKERNIKIIFFSALLENENLKKANRKSSESENVSNQSDDDEEEEDEGQDADEDGVETDLANADELVDKLKVDLNISAQPSLLNDDHIFDKYELIDTWRSLLLEIERDRDKKLPRELSDESKDQTPEYEESEASASHDRPLTVGLVGYPNVGKSSTINALLSAKRVAVSATPGKTKHFQTFLIDRDMMLCDCPGLVFPNFVSNKSEMVINGVLPIDQMKDCIGPVRLIVERIPRIFLEEIYGLAFEQDAKQNIIAEDLLNAFGFMRGYMTSRGLPDISRASRVICKDYINGKILYCEPPPNADRKEYHSHSKLSDAMKRIEELRKDPKYALKITERQRRLMVLAKGNDISSREFDSQFFQARTCGTTHIKGLPGIGNMTQPIGKLTGETKVPKREKRHRKKEKLRRVYSYLDN